MKQVSVKKVNIPLPDVGEKADAIPHQRLLLLQWICDVCQCVNSHKIGAKSVYSDSDIEHVAVAAFNFAFYDCKCCNDKTINVAKKK